MLSTVLLSVPLNVGAAEASVSDTGSEAAFEPTGSQSGKVVYLLSDSIGEGFLQHEMYVQKKWLDVVVEENGYDAEKSKMIGESGLGFCNRGAYYGRYMQYYLDNTDFSEADIVIVALGINDWKAADANYKITPDMVYEKMQVAFDKIRSDNPTCELYYFSPFNTAWIGDYNSYYALNKTGDAKPRCFGYTLGTFADMLKQKLTEAPLSSYGVTYVDMTECASINRDTIRAGCFHDRIHPNQATHIEMGKEIAPILMAHGHRLVEHPAVAPTCAEGNTVYWSCSDCGKFFSDEYAENEIAENSWVVPAVDEHELVGSPSWTWVGNDTTGYTSASFDDTCSVCGSAVGVPATVTKTHTYGKRVYTATATFGGHEYSDTKTVEGKALYVLGDSIALGESAGGTNYSWVKHLADINGYMPFSENGSKNLSANRLGFTFASTTAKKAAPALVNEIDFSNADVVVVALGMEDWRYSTSTSAKFDSFYPAMYNVFAKIRSDNPVCKIFFVLPFNNKLKGNYNSYFSLNTVFASGYNSYPCGQTLQGFVDKIKAKFQESDYQALNVQLLDMLECEAINRDTIQNGALATTVYPTAATHIALANELAPLIASNGHRLTAHEAVAATCGSEGSSAYWSCDDCGKFFSDDSAENEIAENSWIIPADPSGHHLTAHEAVAANCSHTGSSAYWSCDICGNYYSDANGQHKIAENSWVTPKASNKHSSFEVVSWNWYGSDSEGYTTARVNLRCTSCGATPFMTVPVTTTHTMAHTEYIATLNVAATGQVFTDSKVIEGKVLYVLGDSIELGFINEGTHIVNRWFERVVDLNDYAVNSKIIGEDGLGFCTRGSLDKLYLADYVNGTDFSLADIVVVALGINDWKNTDATTDALYERMEFAFNKIRTDNPDCEIYFLSPFNTSITGDYSTYYSLNAPGDVGDRCFAYGLGDFADLMKAKIESAPISENDVTYIDMTECDAINRDTIRDGALIGNIHPSEATHQALGNEIAPLLMAHGHRLTAHPETAPTCIDGNTAYWSCSDCGKFFSDEYGTDEIAENSWIIPAVNSHNMTESWTWTGSDADGYTAAAVTVTCSSCGTQENLSAVVTKTYTPENTVYTATATATDGQTFTDTKYVAGQVYFPGHSLSLNGDICVNFYLNLSEDQAANAVVDFSWIVDGKEKTDSVDLSEAPECSNGYKTTCNISPAEMSSEITATLMIGGEEVETDTYSIKQYANVILTDGDFGTKYVAQYGQEKYDALVELIHAMLDFGSRAQIRFERDADRLVNDGVYTYTDAVTPAMIPVTMSNMDASDYGLKYTGSSVVLLTKTSVRHYYEITDQTEFDKVKDSVTFNGEAVTYTTKKNEIYFELTDIAASDLDTVYTLHIGDTDYAYAVTDYIRNSLSKTGDNVNADTQALVSAMYYYNQKANVFFGEPIVEPERYEWSQTSSAVRNYLANADYDPSDYSKSVIADYAPTERSIPDERPSGATFTIKKAGTLTIGDYTQQVEAGSFTAYNVIPNSDTPFSVVDSNGKVTQWGSLNPTHFLRQINSTNARNIRDLGGWACDGGTVKYGLIIRGGVPTAAEREVLVNQLGIRSEFELRSKIDADLKDNPPTASVLGDEVTYHIYDNYAWYSFSRRALCKEIIGDIFEAVENDEPVYIHCHAGADRTGTIAFILEAILGMSQSDMDMDYELTTFYVGGKNARCRNDADKWLSMMNEINNKSGATFRDKAVRCVLDLGFTIDDINAFRAKMIEGTPEILTVD